MNEKIKKYYDINNYEDFKNRPDGIIKHSVPFQKMVKLPEGIAGDNVVVPSFIYDILKKRIKHLEDLLKQSDNSDSVKCSCGEKAVVHKCLECYKMNVMGDK
jgi:hypothetical protein